MHLWNFIVSVPRHFKAVVLLAVLSLIGVTSSAVAAAGATVRPDFMTMGMGLFGGLAMFLIGMERISDALKRAADRSRLEE